MQVPIVSGIYADTSPDFRTSFPINLRPVPKATGISDGYLKPTEGLVQNGTGPGQTRGGIEWDGVCYRVMGTKLVSVASDGVVTVLGDVGSGGTVSMTYSFDRLAVAAGGKLFYWDKTTLTEVTDPDLGTVLDVIWTDGYFVTTDGEFIVTTELLDPTAIDPLKYGSSEFEPDPIVAIERVRNEVYAINRYSIEAFQNTGGENFPFTVIRGAQIERGAVGTHAVCRFTDGIAFVGSGRGEAVGVYIGLNGSSQKISTRDIDKELSKLTDAELSAIVMERMAWDGFDLLLIHLPDVTLAFDANATAAMSVPAWYQIATATAPSYRGAYQGRHFVYCYGKWLVGNPASSQVGYMSDTVMTHWGQRVGWRFATPVIYNMGAGAILHELELVGVGGNVDEPATIETEYSLDGVEWSLPLRISVSDNRNKRMRWARLGKLSNFRMQRFSGDSAAPISFARLEARVEPLAW